MTPCAATVIEVAAERQVPPPAIAAIELATSALLMLDAGIQHRIADHDIVRIDQQDAVLAVGAADIDFEPLCQIERAERGQFDETGAARRRAGVEPCAGVDGQIRAGFDDDVSGIAGLAARIQRRRTADADRAARQHHNVAALPAVFARDEAPVDPGAVIGDDLDGAILHDDAVRAAQPLRIDGRCEFHGVIAGDDIARAADKHILTGQAHRIDRVDAAANADIARPAKSAPCRPADCRPRL